MTRPATVAVIQGEGVGPEVTRAAIDVVNAAGGAVSWMPCDRLMPGPDHELFKAIDRSDAALFGATSGPSEKALVHLRWGRSTFANVRPVQWVRGALSPLAHPEAVDFVIVRENLEDLYVSFEGDAAELAALPRGPKRPTASGGRYAVKLVTEEGTRRVAEYAFRLAQDRSELRGSRPEVVVGTKHNVLPATDGLFREVALDVAAGFPDVAVSSRIVDDLAHAMVGRPDTLDVVLLPNQYGDILSDAAAALVGGMGVAPSGCYGDGFAYFEPVHGSAPDIAGKGLANPTAAILSAAMLLEHVDQKTAATRIRRGVADAYASANGALPVDQGGNATTAQFTDRVVTAMRAG